MNASKIVCFVIAFTLAFLAAVPVRAECGLASWYRSDGNLTAAGEHQTGETLTAAHRTLAFGTLVKVRHQKTGKEVTVRINDRGPYVGKRIIDLSQSARRALAMDDVAPVCLSVINGDTEHPAANGWKAETVSLPETRSLIQQASVAASVAN